MHERENGPAGMHAVAVGAIDLKIGPGTVVQRRGHVPRRSELRPILGGDRLLKQPNLCEEIDL